MKNKVRVDIKQWGMTLVRIFLHFLKVQEFPTSVGRMFSRNCYKLSEHFGTTCKNCFLIYIRMHLYIMYMYVHVLIHNVHVCTCTYMYLSDFRPVEVYFASCSHDNTARLWSTDLAYPLRIFAGHTSAVNVSVCGGGGFVCGCVYMCMLKCYECVTVCVCMCMCVCCSANVHVHV